MMRTFLATMLVGLAGLWSVPIASGQAPPVPAPSVPPPPPAPPADTADEKKEEAPKPEPDMAIELKDKRDCVIPGKHGDALAEGGKIEVKTPEPNTLTAALTGVTAAHCYVGCHSQGIQTFQLVQEFEITSTKPAITQVALELKATLNGYVRSKHKGTACMRLASATVAPAGWGSAPLGVTFPPMSAGGSGAGSEYHQEYTSPEGAPLPLGRYVLTANFVLEASADGFLNGRGVADFSPDDLPDLWKQEKDPFKDVERKDFGFNITLTANAPGAAGQATSSLRIRPVAGNVKRVSYNPPAVLSTRTVAPSPVAGLARRLGR